MLEDWMIVIVDVQLQRHKVLVFTAERSDSDKTTTLASCWNTITKDLFIHVGPRYP